MPLTIEQYEKLREVKFRGKRFDNGDWIYGAAYQRYNGQFFIIYDCFDEDYSFVFKGLEVDPKTVGQYTGLKDAKGTEIYEGDIVKCGESISVVEWEESIDQDFFWGNACGFVFNFDPSVMGKEVEYEVIGNIYENQDLLVGRE